MLVRFPPRDRLIVGLVLLPIALAVYGLVRLVQWLGGEKAGAR